MRYTKLICRVAKASIQGGAELGVRLSPLRLDPDEAATLVEDVRDILGDSVHLAAFIPGAPERDEERVYIGDEERAAERATFWRNTVQPDRGEHVLYIAARRHGKAGGLEDTLLPIDEQRLMSGFVEWCEGCEALPRGFSEALREAEITTRMEARSLCEYTAAYLERVGDVPDWSLAGELLPILSLPRDTNLSDEDAAARLRANMLWATSAATGEARGVKPKSEEAKDALERIERAFEQLGDARLEQLTGVDLGVLETSELAKGKKPARKKQVTTLNEKALPKEEKKPPKKRTRKTPKAKGLDAQAAVLEKSLSVAPEEASAPRPIASSEKLVAATFGRAVPPSPASPLKPKAPSPKATTPAPAPSGGDAPAAGGAWTEAMQEREFGGVGRLPQGLYELIHASLASPEGEALRWRVSRGPLKPLLEVLPRGLEPPVKQPLELTGSAGVALEAWQRRRGELARALLAGASKQANFVKMINAPLLMLQDDGVRAMAQALVQASADLYNLAAADHGVDASTRARVLALDTMHIEADDGQHLIVLSPLHPLKLGQALARYDALTQAHDTSPNIRSVMTRSLLQAPVCPSSWPLEGGNELSLSQTDQNIIVYESNPADASDADIEIACELLLLQYLDLHPHARVGVNAIIRGGSPGPALEGFASALAKAEGAKLNAFISVNNDGITRRRASAVIEEKRLTLRATPADEARLKPHLVIQLNPSAVGEEALMTSSPPRAQYTGGVAALMPSFMLVGEGLVTRTSVAGVLGVDETEALLASLRGHARRGFLELAEAAARLSAVFPNSTSQELTWQATISAHVSRRPRSGASLLIYEDVGDDARVAVVTSSMRPVIQVLRKAFSHMGAGDLRDSDLEAIATHLAAANNKGLLSLVYTEEQSLAAALLGLWLRVKMVDTRGAVAPIEGSLASTLLGAHDETSAGAFALATHWHRGRLQVQVGYAALAAPMELRRSNGRLNGLLYTKLGRLVEIVKRALEGGETLSARAAREAFNWLLWPALAAEPSPPRALIDAMDALPRGIDYDLSVSVLLPPSHEAVERGALNNIGDAPIELVCGDLAWIEKLLMDSQGALL